MDDAKRDKIPVSAESVGSREKSAKRVDDESEGVASWHWGEEDGKGRGFTLSRISEKAKIASGWSRAGCDEQRHVCRKRRTRRSWSLCIETLRAFYRGTHAFASSLVRLVIPVRSPYRVPSPSPLPCSRIAKPRDTLRILGNCRTGKWDTSVDA